MNQVFVFPPAYYQMYPGLVIATQPFPAYSSQSILDQIPDDGLERVQRAFLSGEVFQPMGDPLQPKTYSVDLSTAICQSLSIRGSLKKGPTPSFARPNQGEISLETALLKALDGIVLKCTVTLPHHHIMYFQVISSSGHGLLL